MRTHSSIVRVGELVGPHFVRGKDLLGHPCFMGTVFAERGLLRLPDIFIPKRMIRIVGLSEYLPGMDVPHSFGPSLSLMALPLLWSRPEIERILVTHNVFERRGCQYYLQLIRQGPCRWRPVLGTWGQLTKRGTNHYLRAL